MNLILNIIVLIFEVLYYALFMKFARKEGKFSRYLLLFSLITLILYIIGTDDLYAHLMSVCLMLFGLKYITKIKISLYDMLIIFIMLLTKLIIELPISIFLYMFSKNIYIISIFSGIIKLLILFISNYNLNVLYNKFYALWKNNNFYIRYIFTIFMFLYVILTCVFFIIQWI